MTIEKKMAGMIGAAVLALAVMAMPAAAQVGKSLGVVDANTAPEKDLLAMPHMTPAIVKGLLEKRPFASITDLNAYLLSQKLTPEQATEFYRKAFVHINLNTATAAQIATLPGIGEKAAERIIEYREKNGGFKKPEELMNVKGIGEKSFLKLKPLITVTEPKAPKP